MSNTQNLISESVLNEFIQTNLIDPAKGILQIQQAFTAAPNLATAAIIAAFSSNPHSAHNDLLNFKLEELNRNDTTNKVMRNLHKKAWVSFHDLLCDHLTAATANHFKQNYIYHSVRAENLGSPSLDKLVNILDELSPLEHQIKELIKVKPLFDQVTDNLLDSKFRLNTGTIEQKIQFTATLAHLLICINNLTQPFHMPKQAELSIEHYQNLISDLKKNQNNTATTLNNMLTIRVFANGNIDIAIKFRHSSEAIKETFK